MGYKSLYIFDLDGTLADPHHRLPILLDGTSDRWERFYDLCHLDAPIWSVLKVLNALVCTGNEVWVLSGRSARVRQKTVDWLQKYTVLDNLHLQNGLMMRAVDDFRQDAVVKQEFLDRMRVNDRERLSAVFDDRQQVVDMWRRNGIQCFQVAKGDF